jgi:hypothetical protein
MRLFRLMPLALLALAGCDDERTIITHTNRVVAISLSDLPALQQGGGVPVEIHGTPFAGVGADELASALKPPPGRSQSTRFRAIPPGHGGPGFHGDRMVLHFNAQGAPNGPQDCARTGEARTGAPRERGFTVMLTFCKGDKWQAMGFLEALDTAPGDIEAYRNAIQQLLLAIFADGTDPGDRR